MFDPVEPMAQSEHENLAYDSERQYIGTVYAKSLLTVAASDGGTDSVLEEFDSAVGVFDKLPQMYGALCSSRVALEEKVALIDKAFANGSKTFRNFMKVVCQHGRFDCLRVIQRSAHAMHDEASGRVEVTLVTADTIDDSMKQRVSERLAKVLDREVRLRTKVDASILGGLVVRVGDTVYDGSLANQLQQVRRSALNQAVHEIRQSMDRFVIEA